MPIILPVEEDKERANQYNEIYNEMFGDKKDGLTSEEISRYARCCINPKEIKNKKPLLKSSKRKKVHLEDILLPKLFEIAVEHEESGVAGKRVCDRDAIRLIRGYCKGSLGFVREYYKFYKETKKKFFYVA